MRALLLAILTLALIAPSANAAFVHGVDGVEIQPYASWADSSKAFPPSGDVTIHPNASMGADCLDADALGCHQPGHIWLAPLATRSVFLHELGRELDTAMMVHDSRATFQRIMNLPGTWEGVPEERFAEAYRFCALYGDRPTKLALRNITGGAVRSPYEYLPSVLQYRQSCRLMTRVASRD